MSDKVSVIMSTYREKEEHLRMSIESILNQTYQKFEFIIVIDDPANSELNNVVFEYASNDSRIKVFVNEKNMGLTFCRNKSLALCSGEYIAIMDADDIAETDRIAVEIEYLRKHPEVGAVFSGRMDIGEDGEVLKRFSKQGMKDSYIPKILQYGTPIINPTTMIRAETFKKVNGYREIPAAEDYDLWLRCCAKKVRFHFINQSLLKYRIREGSLSHANFAKTWTSWQYVRKLNKERRKNGYDSFSEENFKEYIGNSVMRSEQAMNAFNERYRYFKSGIDEIKQKRIKGVLKIIKSFFENKEFICVFYVFLMFHLQCKRAKIM